MQVNQKFHSYAYSKDNLNFLYLITKWKRKKILSKLKKKQEEEKKQKNKKGIYIYIIVFYASDPKRKSLVPPKMDFRIRPKPNLN